ncbi:MAG TPA: SPW repeat protein [Candidatus Paceibacterota bacterium]|nr:SPW repeat protein [Candidatus Paceibacterota bacterium]
MWQQWINVLLGLWVIAVPFLGMTAGALTWSLVISGLVIAGLGLWGAQETTEERRSGAMMQRRAQQ